jgi:hypothetical protein
MDMSTYKDSAIPGQMLGQPRILDQNLRNFNSQRKHGMIYQGIALQPLSTSEQLPIQTRWRVGCAKKTESISHGTEEIIYRSLSQIMRLSWNSTL